MAAHRATGLALALVACVLLVVPALVRGQDAHTSVVGGTTAEAGEYPWQVAVFKRQGNKRYFICGGTLIAPQRVVTAAHCTSGGSGSIEVRVGTQLWNSGGQFISTTYTDHPSYSSSTDRFDAAVLELASSAGPAGGQPLQLIGPEGSADDTLWAPGVLFAISGWGSTTEGGNISNQLREARVPRVADSTCAQADYYGTAFHAPTMVCAGLAAGGVDTCQGDSGGPLAASTQDSLPASENDPSQWRLVGITSWGIGCARPKKPGVYTRVAAPAIRDWILGSPLFALTVSVSGSGSGTVTSNDGNIACPPECSFGYESGTVTLTANPAAGSTFAGWSGACSGTEPCNVVMDQARSVTAQFTSPTPVTRTLTVVKQGGGKGTVTSNPDGINCGGDCTQNYPHGTSVKLTAAPASGSTFAGWDGAGCSGTATTCTVTMDQAREVSATFGIQQQLPVDPPPPDEDPAQPDDPAPEPEPGPDDTPSTADQTPPVAAIASNRLRMSRRGVVRVRIDCGDSPEDCLGEVRLRLRLPTGDGDKALMQVGRAELKIAAGEDKRVRVRLKRRARRYVRREGPVRVRVIAIVEDAAGNAVKLRKKLKLRAAR